MKKYLLVLLNSELPDEKVNFILGRMTEIISSSYLKYRYFDKNIVLHFGSSANFSALSRYTESVMKKCQCAYLLLEYTDNMSFNIADYFTEGVEDNTLEDFLCLTGEPVFISQEQNEQYDPLLEELLDYVETFDDEDDDYYDYLKPKSEVEYDLDMILDKINDKGVDSLTEGEKSFLNKIK
jgi:hypothetical protein